MTREYSYTVPKEPRKFPDYGNGKCLYCGADLTGRQTKYCSPHHGDLYRRDTATYYVVSWQEYRDKIIKRDKRKCQDCGSHQQLEVHHILPISEGGEVFEDDNCITLCFKCHRARHHEGTKAQQKEIEESKIKEQIEQNRMNWEKWSVS